jgi:hypothetical protein
MGNEEEIEVEEFLDLQVFHEFLEYLIHWVNMILTIVHGNLLLI